jgi:hypothetical protein
MSGVVRLRFRLGVRLRFRQRSRLWFPAVWAPLGGFPCIRAGFSGDCGGDVSVSAGECPVSRPLTRDSRVLCLAVRVLALRLPWAARWAASLAVRSGRSLLVAWTGTVGFACRVVASRRRCFAALARLLVPAVAFPVLRCIAGRGCTVGRWCYGPRAAWRRAGGAR